MTIESPRLVLIVPRSGHFLCLDVRRHVLDMVFEGGQIHRATVASYSDVLELCAGHPFRGGWMRMPSGTECVVIDAHSVILSLPSELPTPTAFASSCDRWIQRRLQAGLRRGWQDAVFQ